jgi:hypothetical protein
MNKLAHGIVLAFFGMACWCLWAVLQLPLMVRLHGVAFQLPAFTRFCIAMGIRMVVGLPILAACYCLWVWLKKADSRLSWVSFLAVTTAALVFVTLPTIIALYLPLVAALGHLSTQ